MKTVKHFAFRFGISNETNRSHVNNTKLAWKLISEFLMLYQKETSSDYWTRACYCCHITTKPRSQTKYSQRMKNGLCIIVGTENIIDWQLILSEVPRNWALYKKNNNAVSLVHQCWYCHYEFLRSRQTDKDNI